MQFQRYPKILTKKKDKTTTFVFWTFVSFFAFFVLVLSLNVYNPSLVPFELRLISLSKKQNILVLGCDEVFLNPKQIHKSDSWKGRSDTIAVISTDPINNSLGVLNIPRDTKVYVRGHGNEKINYLNSVGGPEFTKKYLEKFLDIKIDHYVVVNVKGLSTVIDEIGGIVIDVPRKMKYNDYSGMLHIDLEPGKQLLDGEAAVGYVRFRHDSLGDIGRIQRQQLFMRAVFKKLLDPITFTKLPEIVSIYEKTVFTDMKPRDIIKIANFARNVPSSKQNIVILPGDFGSENGISYWVPNEYEIEKVIKKIFYKTKTNQGFAKLAKINPTDIKICIFNGSDKDNFLASKISALLKESGYTVLSIQNYESHVKTTKIYAQKANSEEAQQVKYDLGNVGELLNGNLGPPEADVTILAGDDLVSKIKQRKKS